MPTPPTVLVTAISLVMGTSLSPGAGGGERSQLKSASALELGTLEPSRLDRNRPALARPALEPARGGLQDVKLEGAPSSIPPSRLGFLFFGVAQELEKLEGETTETAIGYYMAALTDLRGPRREEAKRKIRSTIGRNDLAPKDARRLFKGGLKKLRDLHRSKLGITRNGLARALGEIRGLKLDLAGRMGGSAAAHQDG